MKSSSIVGLSNHVYNASSAYRGTRCKVQVNVKVEFQAFLNRLLDLFDKRYKVYDATKQFLGGIMSSATFTDAQLFTFYAGTSDAEFLFDTEIGEYLLQVRKRALDMRLQAKLYQRAEGDERTRMIDAESQHLLWLTDQLTGMSKVFAPYLSYAKVKGDFLEDFIRKHQ